MVRFNGALLASRGGYDARNANTDRAVAAYEAWRPSGRRFVDKDANDPIAERLHPRHSAGWFDLSTAYDPMFTLYYAKGSCALASHIALEDAGASYALKRVDFANREQQSPGYLKINPKGRVPALETPRGILTETPAILAFIAQSFPAAGLAPLSDPFAFAELQSFTSYLCATVHVAHAHRMRGHRWASDASSFADMQRKVPESVGACFDLIETRMLRDPWVMGESYTVADPYLFTIAQWLEGDGIDPKRFPRVYEHMTRMAERPSVKTAMAAESSE